MPASYHRHVVDEIIDHVSRRIVCNLRHGRKAGYEKLGSSVEVGRCRQSLEPQRICDVKALPGAPSRQFMPRVSCPQLVHNLRAENVCIDKRHIVNGARSILVAGRGNFAVRGTFLYVSPGKSPKNGILVIETMVDS